MLSKVWAVVGAVVCGVVLATLPAGSMPAIARLVLLAALLAGLAATVAVRAIHAPGRNDDGRLQPWEPSAGDLELSAIDNLALVSRVIQPSVIDWLRRESFAEPWRDDRVAPIRKLAVLETGSAGYDHSLARLTKAASSFLLVYDGNTVEDPMIRDSKWRMLGPATAVEGLAEPAASRATSVQIDLRYAAAELCESYDALASSVSQVGTAR